MKPRFHTNFWVERLPTADTKPPQERTGLEVTAHSRLADSTPGVTPWLCRRELAKRSPARRIAVFVPENYEPNYAYPLIVWLHGNGGNELELFDLMAQISSRNYVGLSVRAPLAATNGLGRRFRWSLSERAVDDFREQLYAAVCGIRRDYHVHSERVFIGGFDAGGTMALRLMLSRPAWFGGAAAFAARFPETKAPLARFRELRGKRVLLGAGSCDTTVSLAEVIRAGRLLHSAGMEVTTRIDNTGHQVTPQALSQFNRWVMEGVCAAA